MSDPGVLVTDPAQIAALDKVFGVSRDQTSTSSQQLFLRKNQLIVGTQGNAGGLSIGGKTYPVVNGKVTIPASVYNSMSDLAGGSGASSNPDGSYTLEGVTPNTQPTPNSGIDLSQLRIVFKIDRNSISTPNTASFRIYNLSRATTSRMQREFNQVSFMTGYGDGPLSTIFQGSIVRMQRGSQVARNETSPAIFGQRENQTDTYVEFTAVDGDVAFNFAVMSVSLVAGSTVEQQFNAISAALAPYSIGMGYYNLKGTANQTLPRGLVLHGMVRDVLDSFCVYTGTTWSIQDGKVEIIVKTQGAIPGDAIVLGPKNGLIGIPRETVSGIEFTSLLNPLLRPGRAVQILSYINQAAPPTPLPGSTLGPPDPIQNQLNPLGFYRIFWFQHVGDTRGNQWYTNCIGRAILPDGSTAPANPGAASTIQYN